MVDTIIVADAVSLSFYPNIAVIVVSDDIDLAPGLALAGIQRERLAVSPGSTPSVAWLRRNPPSGQVLRLQNLVKIEDW
jgi:hypothetical protein